MNAAGITANQATYAQYAGYSSVGLLVQALKSTGKNPSNSNIIAALSNIHDFNSMGLYGGMKLDINNRTDFVAGPNNCAFVAKFEGNSFVAVKGMQPICGKVVPGKTVSSSS